MGLSWQQGPLGRNPNGRFITADPLPERLLYTEPLRRRMRVELGGGVIAQSDNVQILYEPARYPVAYFPVGDIAGGVLRPSDRRTDHPDLGETAWLDVVGADGAVSRRAAWQHVDPPTSAGTLRDTVAFAWRAMDGFFEEDERILGHAADPYHRIDIRRSARHLKVIADGRAVADTHASLVLYESGFAPRWYVPRSDVVGKELTPVDGMTFCPYKGLASYYDVAGVARGAWSYRAPIDEMPRIADHVSFEPDKVEVLIDGERLLPAAGQNVVAHGVDRDLSVDEAGGIELTAERESAW
ncbi:MAG TPA: DUF427 domain-containing protein [Conexibacter sp.]|jgi:uncharacterized protein (DUF427 family)